MPWRPGAPPRFPLNRLDVPPGGTPRVHQDVDTVQSDQSFRCAGSGEVQGEQLRHADVGAYGVGNGGELVGIVRDQNQVASFSKGMRQIFPGPCGALVTRTRRPARPKFVWFSRSVSTFLGRTINRSGFGKPPAPRRVDTPTEQTRRTHYPALCRKSAVIKLGMGVCWQDAKAAAYRAITNAATCRCRG